MVILYILYGTTLSGVCRVLIRKVQVLGESNLERIPILELELLEPVGIH